MSVFGRKMLVLGGLVTGAVALPSIGWAFSTGFDSQPVSLSARGGLGSFTPASIDPRMASALRFNAVRGKNFRFTPAAQSDGEQRSVTVAVRINPESAQAVNIRPIVESTTGAASPLKITPTAFSLGVAKGWQKFALPGEVRSISMPDLGAVGKRAGMDADRAASSRFNTKIELDANRLTGTAPRTFDGQDGYKVDVGGSYKLTRNLDVTAGVRLQSERDRLAPLTNDQRDSQAVYVGTQFRF